MSDLNVKLAGCCAALWGAGVLGMAVARGIFEHCPGAPPFDLCAVLSLVGGATYCWMGVIALLVPQDDRA